MKVKHLKTGNIYEVELIATDATNATEGRKMVVYRREYQGDGEPRPTYVREETEFWQKFEKEPDRCCCCGATENLHKDGYYGYRCSSRDCVVF